MARECGIELDIIFKALENYQGSRRRMEIKYEDEKYILIDDYAHHPTEIQVTLQALKKAYDRPVLAVFQPHLYSRTSSFYKDFAGVLKLADRALVTDIYPAREKPIPGVSSRLITNLDEHIKYCKQENLLDMILDIMEPGQIIITLGAGDINQIHTELINKISEYNN
jgi:UDP-N-acetylmuramate--alanine ligase